MTSGQTRAVVVGVDGCPRDHRSFPKLDAVQASATDIARHLSDPNLVGINPRDIRLLINSERSTIIEQVQTAAREADELLIFYYCGHGQTDIKDDLYLTTSDTTFELLNTHAINFETIRTMIRDSKAKTKAVFLDCCYSGRALEYMSSSAPKLLESIKETGTCAIASSPGDHKSLAPLGALYTLFTGEIIDTLSRGIENDEPKITLGQLFDVVSEKVTSSGGAKPQKTVVANGADYQLSNNVAFGNRLADTVRELNNKFCNLQTTVNEFNNNATDKPQFSESDIRALISNELKTQTEAIERKYASAKHTSKKKKLTLLQRAEHTTKNHIFPTAIGLAPTACTFFTPLIFTLADPKLYRYATYSEVRILPLFLTTLLCFWQALTISTSYLASTPTRKRLSMFHRVSHILPDISRALFKPLMSQYALNHPSSLTFTVSVFSTPIFIASALMNYRIAIGIQL